MFWNSRKKGNFSYESAGAMLSPAELSFYQVVSAAVGKSALLFCKVSMASIIRPHHELSDSRWRKLSREIESQQLEFVLIDAASLEPLCVLEFEDSSQIDDERQAHQKFIHSVCEAASIPWVMVDARGGFAINDIRQQLAFLWSAESDGVIAYDEIARQDTVVSHAPPVESETPVTSPEEDIWCLSGDSGDDHSVPLATSMPLDADNSLNSEISVTPPKPEPVSQSSVGKTAESVESASKSNVAPAVSSPEVIPKTQNKQIPECPKCHSGLVRRQPKTGKLAGQTLWVCSTYPACRYLAPLKAHDIAKKQPDAVA